MKRLGVLLASLAVAAANTIAAGAADQPADSGKEAVKAGGGAKTESQSPMIVKPMSGKGPMSGEMKRPGMMKEDVKKAAEEKEPMLEKAMKGEEGKGRK